MKKAVRTKDIHTLITDYTTNGITTRSYDFSACNAHDIALILKIDRTNVSRVLNQLHREKRFIKVQGRPTLYLDASVIHSFASVPVPYILPSGNVIQDYLKQDAVKKKESGNRKLQPLTYIGIQPKEALFDVYEELMAALHYPFQTLMIALRSRPGEGRHHFMHFLVEKIQQEHLLSGSMTIEQLDLSDDMTKEDIHSVVSHTEESAQCLWVNVIGKNDATLRWVVEELAHITPANKRLVCFFLSDTCQKQEDILRRHISLMVSFPAYTQRTLKERMELLFGQIQKQADLLNETICLNKNVLTCLVLSERHMTTCDILQELQQTLYRAHYHFLKRKANVIDITFDHLSDSLLNNIGEVNNRFAQLQSILDLFDSDVLYFIPQTSCRFYNLLHSAVLNEEGLICSEQREQLISFCQTMLKKTEKIEINTIRSIYVKELYDIVFPILSSTPLSRKETTIFVLLEYLQNLLDELKNHTYQAPLYEAQGLRNKQCEQLSKNIQNAIHTRMHIDLPEIEVTLICTYLYLAIQKLEAKPPLVFLCHGEDIAANYEKYIRSANLYHNVYSINYDDSWKQQDYRLFLDFVASALTKLEHYEHAIFFADIAPLTEISEHLNHRLHIQTKLLSPISLPLILNTISSLNEHQPQEELPMKAVPMSADLTALNEHSKTLIDRISALILQQSLVFLDAAKASNALMIVLLNILKRLQLNYTDEITIRFIIHGAFVIERAIRNEPLPNKKTREIIAAHTDMYNIISDELGYINNIFNINIAKTEIATIAQIFLEYS